MSSPTPSDVHVNQPLTNISIAYLQDDSNFVASKVFPNIPVSKQADRYYTYDRGEFNRDEMELRAPGTESAGGSYTVDNTPTYYANTYAFHKDVPDQVRANADSVLNMDRDATVYVTKKALIRREKIWATNYFATSKWGADIEGVSASPTGTQVLQWNDASSTPIENVQAQSTAILQSTGFEPNTLVLGKPVYDALKNHPDVVDRIKYGQTAGGPAKTTLQALAEIMDLDRILVMKAIENTAAKGATNVHAFIGGKSALLCYSAPAPGLLVPSAGYTFSWTGLLGSGAEGNRVSKFRMEHLKSDRIEIEMSVDLKLIGADLGRFFYTIVA